MLSLLFVYTYTTYLLGEFIDVVLRKACVINHDAPWSLCLYVYECIFFMLVASFMQTMKKGINFIL
jgi:hypothetical protein